MAKRAAEDREWECHRADLYRLYIAENKTLGDVMALMKEKGFFRSKPQYERVFKRWGFHKNLAAKNWRAVGHHIEKRQIQGKHSAVRIHGVLADTTIVQRRLARHDYQGFFERELSKVQRGRSPTLHPGIILSTPSPPPMTEGGAITPFLESYPLIPVDVNFLKICGQATPWYDFTTFLKSLDDAIIPDNLLVPPERFTKDTALEQYPGLPIDVEILPVTRSSALETWCDDLMGYSLLQLEENNNSQLSTIIENTTAFLPPTPCEISDINVGMASSIAHRSCQVEFLKLAVMLLSNNAYVPNLEEAIVELLQAERNLSFLRNLLAQRLWSVSAFAERLLPLAAEIGDLRLLKVLCRSGADINANPEYPRSTPLMHAISQNQQHIFQYLLDNGAGFSDIYPEPEDTTRSISPLDYAVRRDNLTMVKLLLSGKRSEKLLPTVDIATLYLAVKFMQYTMLHYLLRERPDLKKEFVRHPWIFLKEAVSSEDLLMLNTLVGYGLDIKRAIEAGDGGVLVEAVAGGNEDLVLRLLGLGFDPSSTKTVNCCVTCADNCKRLGHFYLVGRLFGFAPLHVSLMKGCHSISEKLVSHGANIDQSCYGISPLQIAVACRDKQSVKMLIDAGAEVNAPCRMNNNDWDSWKHACRAGKIETCECISICTRLLKYQLELPLGYQLDLGSEFEVEFGSETREAAKKLLDYPSKPVLQTAMELGDEGIFKVLMGNGAKLPTTGLWDPWISAFTGRNDYIISYLESAVPVPMRSASALSACLINCGTSVANTLISRGVFDNQLDFSYPETLEAAAENSDIELIQYILSKIDGDRLEEMILRGLTKAAVSYNIDAIRIFLKAGAKPYKISGKRSPLETFFKHVHKNYHRNLPFSTLEVAARLLVEACNLRKPVVCDEEDYERKTALKLGFGSAVRCVVQRFWNFQLFFDAGLSPNDTMAISPVPAVQIAMCWNHPRLASQLIESATSIDLPASFNMHSFYEVDSLLQASAKNNNASLAKVLVERGVNVNANPVFGGATALQYAAIAGNFEITELLLSHGADVNARPAPSWPLRAGGGRYAIEGAAESGRLDMVRFLLACGANIKGKNNPMYRRTVYRAWKEGHMTLVRMIQDFKVREYGVDDIEDLNVIVDSMSLDSMSEDSLFWNKEEAEAYGKLRRILFKRVDEMRQGWQHPEPYRKPLVVRWEDFVNGASAEDADLMVF